MRDGRPPHSLIFHSERDDAAAKITPSNIVDMDSNCNKFTSASPMQESRKENSKPQRQTTLVNSPYIKFLVHLRWWGGSNTKPRA